MRELTLIGWPNCYTRWETKRKDKYPEPKAVVSISLSFFPESCLKAVLVAGCIDWLDNAERYIAVSVSKLRMASTRNYQVWM